VFFQFFENGIFEHSRYIFLITIVLTIVFFVIFTQILLNAKIKFPILYKSIKVILIVSVLLRIQVFIIPQFYFDYKPWIMQIWYISVILLIIGIGIELSFSLRKQKKIITLFSFGFLFILVGMAITILHYQKGLINSYLLGLPILLYASILEILFLTLALAYLFKEIYLERNFLSDKVIKQQKQIIASFLEGEEKERKRISIELHDNIGSKLSFLAYRVSGDGQDLKIQNQLNDVFNDVRNLSHSIAPIDFNMVGIRGAIQDLINNYNDVEDINIEFNSYHVTTNFREEICLNLYRITQEALNNIIKHSQASHVDVQLINIDTHINLSIEDNGIGFDIKKQKKGIGLQNIRTRVDQLNGVLSIDSHFEKGSSLLVSIPIIME
jgi:signal transduction histidine kinase